jgi:hypothetical protein
VRDRLSLALNLVQRKQLEPERFDLREYAVKRSLISDLS